MIRDLPLRALVAIQVLTYSLRNDERGQDTLEWVMMGGLIALGITLVAVLWNTVLDTMFTNIGYCIDFNDATTCAPGF